MRQKSALWDVLKRRERECFFLPYHNTPFSSHITVRHGRHQVLPSCAKSARREAHVLDIDPGRRAFPHALTSSVPEPLAEVPRSSSTELHRTSQLRINCNTSQNRTQLAYCCCLKGPGSVFAESGVLGCMSESHQHPSGHHSQANLTDASLLYSSKKRGS